MDKTINVLVSGLGRIAWEYHIPTMMRDLRFHLLAVADPVAERRREAGREWPGVRTYADFDTMCQSETAADMAVIASPTMFHRDQTVTALRHNLAVFLEKPMCESLESARAVADAVAATRGKLMVYQPHRVHGEFLTFQKLVRPKLGRILHSRRTLALFNRRNDWQSRSACGGGMLNNYGAHYIDQFLAAFGPGPVAVRGALLQRTVGIGDAEDLVNVLLESPSGVTGNVEINLGSAVPENSWRVYGDLGCAAWDAVGGAWQIRFVPPGTLRKLELQSTLAAQNRSYSLEGDIPWRNETVAVDQNAQGNYYDHVYDCFAGGAPPFPPLSESMELMRILSVCRRKAGAEEGAASPKESEVRKR